MTKPSLSAAQAKAVLRFATEQGRYWKNELRRYWARECLVYVPPEDAPYLRQVRNHFGPSWLNKVKIQQITECAEAGNANP